MRRCSHLIAALALAASLRPVHSQAAVDCAAEYDKHLESDLALSYLDFDQSGTSGYRVLAALGCREQAAALLESYIARSHELERVMWWHSAQLEAESGDYPGAIATARKSLAANEDFARNPIRWNDYVEATIAFWQHDRAALQQHRAAVAAGAHDFLPNQINLDMLDSLAANFELGYADAMARVKHAHR
jgi:hypothetical protein